MKKMIFLLVMLITVIVSFEQQTNTAVFTKEYYQKKSKNQKTVFYVFATTGTVLIIGGLIYGLAHNDPNRNNYNYTGGFIATGGFISLGISIPFFIASGKNKKKAMSFLLKMK